MWFKNACNFVFVIPLNALDNGGARADFRAMGRYPTHGLE
jgi:hypothetical protein